jgi:hypothetical protein
MYFKVLCGKFFKKIKYPIIILLNIILIIRINIHIFIPTTLFTVFFQPAPFNIQIAYLSVNILKHESSSTN